MNSLWCKGHGKGFQKGMSDGAKEPKGMASCIKHFAAYGAPEGGRDYNTVDMSERRLRQEYLPSYKAGVDAGCEMIMTSFKHGGRHPFHGKQVADGRCAPEGVFRWCCHHSIMLLLPSW